METNNSSDYANTDLTTVDRNLEMMKSISDDCHTLDDIKMLTSSRTTDQLKVFLIAQARKELSRVIKLTEYLDKLETNYMNKVDQAMINDELTLKQYGEVVGIITSLLSRSNSIISNIIKDDSLTAILNTTIYQTNQQVSATTAIVSNLKDSQSRERVRIVLQQVLNNTENYDSVTEEGGQ